MGKRVKVTGKGKIVPSRPASATCWRSKSSTQTRRLTGTVEVAKADIKRIKKLLGR